MWVRTLWPLSSSTRNMALGSGSTTVPSTSIASFFAKRRLTSRHAKTPQATRPRRPDPKYRHRPLDRLPRELTHQKCPRRTCVASPKHVLEDRTLLLGHVAREE